MIARFRRKDSLDTLVAARRETIIDRGLHLAAITPRWPAASHIAERLPYQNAIRHGFVMIAAAIHFLAVLTLVRS